MVKWSHVTIPVAISAAILAILILIVMIRKRCACFRRPKSLERVESLQNGIARLHQVSPLHHDHHLDPQESSKKTTNNYYYLFGQQRASTKNYPSFRWADHPPLATDAVENGWSRFAFTTLVSSSSSSSSVKSAKALFGACATANEEPKVEISWELCEGSADFMQRIRLNPAADSNDVSVIRAALPLPGPDLGINSCFPQESFFEITVVSCFEDHGDQLEEGDKTMLIGESDLKAAADSSSFVASARRQEGKNDESASVGLTRGGSLASRFPGTYPGSIAFYSNGSVYLDGTKLVLETGNNEWGSTNKVIGCGYNPSTKKVFFTVDAQLVHEIHCKTEDFSSPLYPTIAANDEIAVLVNFGQSPFKFAPANLQRTPNPCFVGGLGASPAFGYEDSRELFSMGRIDAEWLQRSANRSHNNTVNSLKALEYDMESDGDLFEIVLERSGRSPYATMHQQ